ncbi:MAG: hypothetical protein ACREF0_17025 [Acetobacteraceae bacterium]
MIGVTGLSTGQFLLAWAIDSALAIAVFLDATRRGNRHATAWGAGVFLCMIIALPLYLIRRRAGRIDRRRY